MAEITMNDGKNFEQGTIKDAINDRINDVAMASPIVEEAVLAAQAYEKLEETGILDSIENTELVQEIERNAEELIQEVLPGFDMEEARQGFESVVHDVANMDWVEVARDVGDGFANVIDDMGPKGNDEMEMDVGGFSELEEEGPVLA